MNCNNCQVASLSAFFLFKGLDETALETIDRELAQPISYTKGERIYDPQEFRKSLGLVLCGTVLVQAPGEQDRPLIINRITAGNAFGAAALFDSQVSDYVTTLTAFDKVSVRYITQEQMSRLFLLFPRTAQNYIEFLSGRVRFLNRKITALTNGSSVNRLYQFCLSRQQEDGTVLLPASMTELARILNMGRSSLYRSLDVLLEQHILEKNGKQYTILQS